MRDFVWMVVNDGGDPGPVEEIVATVSGELEVNLRHHPVSLGMEAASNAGIAACQSKYLVIHDDDDSWQPTFLERTAGFLDSPAGERFGGVVTQSVLVKEKIHNGVCEFVSKHDFNRWMQVVYLVDMAKSNSFPPISFLFRRSVYDEVGGFNENLPVLGDWDFNLRFLLEHDIHVIEELLANYHHRVEQTSTYGNSVLQGDRSHKSYDAMVRNRLLREDLRQNKTGLGVLVNLVKEYEGFDSIASWQNFKRVLSRTRFGWVARYL
ncbi:hypothetical protein GMLC_03130 [Geomonas limicola]|uniref:Glycosyltransferase 2-like domain-containing protein n=2 Tax=Geomonas limicola TaxID=2740186 RepID=A0A6V8N424_9BACT|nr:hypothetical protein GMLC_03130 [Geomonas limicola]